MDLNKDEPKNRSFAVSSYRPRLWSVLRALDLHADLGSVMQGQGERTFSFFFIIRTMPFLLEFLHYFIYSVQIAINFWYLWIFYSPCPFHNKENKALLKRPTRTGALPVKPYNHQLQMCNEVKTSQYHLIALSWWDAGLLLPWKMWKESAFVWNVEQSPGKK